MSSDAEASAALARSSRSFHHLAQLMPMPLCLKILGAILLVDLILLWLNYRFWKHIKSNEGALWQ
jgi:hypothetical protein